MSGAAPSLQDTATAGQAQGAEQIQRSNQAPAQAQQAQAATNKIAIGLLLAATGSIAFSGTYNVNTDAGAQVEFAYDTEFKKCKVDGLRIDGDLAYDLSVATSDTSSSVVYSYQGEIKWSGEIKGSCVIDMTGSVSATVGSASVEYKGSVCGYDASATLNVSVGG